MSLSFSEWLGLAVGGWGDGYWGVCFMRKILGALREKTEKFMTSWKLERAVTLFTQRA